MSERPVRQRFDLLIKRVVPGDQPNHLYFELEFDPRRYEWIEKDGESFLYDRLEKALIPKRVLNELGTQMDGLPLFFQPPLIGNSAEYIQSRRAVVAERLAGTAFNEEALADPSAEFLTEHVGSGLGFAILCIDLVGSTRLANKVDAQVYERIMSTYTDEISRVVPLFRGQVLKYTGDGLIAYFAEPSFITKNDLAIDCAITMRVLVTDALNPALQHEGLPPMSVRIGLDAGDAFVTTLGSASTKRHSDIIGEVVNIAAKVQAISPPNGICLGESAVSALHVSWRERTRPLSVGPEWKVRKRDGTAYEVYELVSPGNAEP